MMNLSKEAEILLRCAASESEDVREKVNDLLKACGLDAYEPPPLSEKEKAQLHRLKNNLAELRNALFIPYANQERTRLTITQYFNIVRAAKMALNEWKLWYDSISKDDKDKGPIYRQTLDVLRRIEELPGHSGGYFKTKELTPEQAALNKSVGEEIHLQTKYDALLAKYWELLYQVENKYPGEDRHATALRYLKERVAQNNSGTGAKEQTDPA